MKIYWEALKKSLSIVFQLGVLIGLIMLLFLLPIGLIYNGNIIVGLLILMFISLPTVLIINELDDNRTPVGYGYQISKQGKIVKKPMRVNPLHTDSKSKKEE